MRLRFLAVCALALVATPTSNAANPAAGTVSAATPTTWTGGPFAASSPGLTPECVDGAPSCDTYRLTIVPAPGNYTVKIRLTPAFPTDDYDLFVYDPNGQQVDSSANPPGFIEEVELDSPAGGVYTVKALAFLVLPGSTYTATATLDGSTAPVVQPAPGSVLWSWDRTAPQATVEVPLRVVLVGFAPGEVDEGTILSEIPSWQRPGVLIPRHTDSNADGYVIPAGGTTLVNHGRAYYNDNRPFLVPYEYRWKPQIVYAPASFTSALFGAMRANSTTADYSSSQKRAWLEQYNLLRGVYRGTGNQVLPNTPIRFVDGEKVEDWIAANSKTYLGWDDPARGKGPGRNPGYTVYFLNTWDSAEARAQLRPQNEYHVWRIDRRDPDTGDFDGIDWARIWGGRYRFMMVDLGAAPNMYEGETWGNRNRAVWGSAAYDPPLWEYRARAPRPVTLTNMDGDRWTQAVTPGERWDEQQLAFMLGRTLNQAASFRFLHSYLYEPWPGTGRYWFSENVWHDAKAELPWASDLTRLYDQDKVLAGLRTLMPYFDFAGDVRFQYLAESGADFDADQAALDQAKLDGDDVAGEIFGQGIPFSAMRTLTAMDYLDSKPERFVRGGACYTSVPGISVVAEKHYAWALPIAAGIATNRDGVPWGYLNSVNDVFKTPQATRDETMRLAHPQVGTGAFTYTAVHEASHYLGLAHPHDSIGATRAPDGSPRYYDGFTWAFNSTAAPTTYSHSEMAYSILDQESIARGHGAYYLKWTDEALTDGGQAYYEEGVTQASQLPELPRKLRDRAISMSAKAEVLFARFDFVNAAFAAQKAWRAAAAYRDLARALPAGTTEVEKGTKKDGAGACPSAKER
jgi:hypothetical protein